MCKMPEERVRFVNLDGLWGRDMGWRYGTRGPIFCCSDYDEVASREARENAEVWGLLDRAMKKLERKAIESCNA